MEQYKKVYQRRIIALGGILMFLGGLLIVGGTLGVYPQYTNPHAADFYRGMLSGAIFAVIVLALAGIVHMLLCLRSEEKLRAAYVQEHDERGCALWQKSAYTGWRVSTIIIILAALTAGYWNLTVSLSLLGAALVSGLTVKLTHLYYNKVM